VNDLMIDIETLDTRNSAVILSIGAVKFDLDKGVIDEEGFYASINVDSCLELGRTISESTLLFWLKQPTEAQVVFHEPKMHLRDALEGFTDWLSHMKRRPWGNGPTFDLAKMTHAYESVGWTAPWDFWNERCVRTYRDLPGAKAIPKVKPAVAHHALHDAYAQAQHVIQIHAALFGAKTTAKVKA
jgi:hypothetical protein